MNNKLTLEKVTMLLQAAERIKSARNLETRDDGSVSVRTDSLSMIHDTMHIICEYLPEIHRIPFNNALKNSHRYCGTYRDLKKHLREMGGQNPDFENITKTLKVIMPMLETRQRTPMNKVINVLEALHN